MQCWCGVCAVPVFGVSVVGWKGDPLGHCQDWLSPLPFPDICLKEVTSIADSLYNIQLLREFSNEYLNKCFYLTLEDMLYAPLVLKVRNMTKYVFFNKKWLNHECFVNVRCNFPFFLFQPNVMVFIAELFWWFENVKPDFVQPRDIQEIKDGKFVTTDNC